MSSGILVQNKMTSSRVRAKKELLRDLLTCEGRKKKLQTKLGHKARIFCCRVKILPPCEQQKDGGQDNWDDRILVATASEDGSIRLWRGKRFTFLHELKGHTEEVLSVAWSHKGDVLASTSADNTVSKYMAMPI